MAGRPGRNRAWNKIPVEVHVQRGTYRRDRHGPLPAWPPMTGEPSRPDASKEPSTPPDTLLEGLTGPGRAFVAQAWGEFSDWTPPLVVLLHEAGRLMDELERVRGTKAEKPAQRLLVSVMATLRMA